MITVRVPHGRRAVLNADEGAPITLTVLSTALAGGVITWSVAARLAVSDLPT